MSYELQVKSFKLGMPQTTTNRMSNLKLFTCNS